MKFKADKDLSYIVSCIRLTLDKNQKKIKIGTLATTKKYQSFSCVMSVEIDREYWNIFIDDIFNKCVELEMYEECTKIKEIQNDLN